MGANMETPVWLSDGLLRGVVFGGASAKPLSRSARISGITSSIFCGASHWVTLRKFREWNGRIVPPSDSQTP